MRVWDLRKKGCSYVLPAHRSLVSAVRFDPGDGHVLLTASYDSAIKVRLTPLLCSPGCFVCQRCLVPALP